MENFIFCAVFLDTTFMMSFKSVLKSQTISTSDMKTLSQLISINIYNFSNVTSVGQKFLLADDL